MGAVRRLIVNADDFGFTRDVNRGIVEAHLRGILTATTLMANGDAFDDAVRLAHEHPTIDVGCHLVLVQGTSLLRAGTLLPSSVSELIQAVLLRRIDPYAELKPQIERILQAGIDPLHLDTHKHTHLLPPILDAVARLSQEYKIPWVRRPFDLPLEAGHVPWSKRALNRGLRIVRSRLHRKLAQHGCRTTDNFAGFQWTGRYRAEQLIALLDLLPEGSTEFMTHPGYCTNELRSSPTRLKESREEELRALTDERVKTALSRADIILLGYRNL